MNESVDIPEASSVFTVVRSKVTVLGSIKSDLEHRQLNLWERGKRSPRNSAEKDDYRLVRPIRAS